MRSPIVLVWDNSLSLHLDMLLQLVAGNESVRRPGLVFRMRNFDLDFIWKRKSLISVHQAHRNASTIGVDSNFDKRKFCE